MSDELRKIVRNKLSEYPLTHPEIDELVDNVLSWHKSERKKWAISRKPKKKEYISLENMEGRHNIDGYNEGVADYIKSIEEG